MKSPGAAEQPGRFILIGSITRLSSRSRDRSARYHFALGDLLSSTKDAGNSTGRRKSRGSSRTEHILPPRRWAVLVPGTSYYVSFLSGSRCGLCMARLFSSARRNTGKFYLVWNMHTCAGRFPFCRRYSGDGINLHHLSLLRSLCIYDILLLRVQIIPHRCEMRGLIAPCTHCAPARDLCMQCEA